MSSPFRASYHQLFKTLHGIRPPRPLRVMAALVFFSIATLVSVMVFVPWVQTASGEGVVTTFHPSDRPQSISAPVKGRIKQWHVHEGSVVKKGDVLLDLVDNDPRYVERLEASLDAAKQKADVARTAAETAKLDFVRKQGLFTQGLASRHDLEKAKIDYQQYLAKQAAAAADMAKMETERSRQDTQTVRAPDDGTIVRLRSGDAATFVKEGDIVADFIPARTIAAVELYVRGLDVPLIRSGAKVRLQFEGWPAIQFSGWPAVSVGSFGGIVKSTDPTISPNGKFRVLVVQDPDEGWPNENFLRFGAQSRGWVLLNTVPVGYEMWRQLNNFPPLPPPGVKNNFLMVQSADKGTDDKNAGP